MQTKGSAVTIDVIKLTSNRLIEAGSDAVTSIDVGGFAGDATDVVYTQSFPLPRAATFCAIVKAASEGAVKLVVDLEASDVVPATEEAADANFSIPDGKDEIIADLAVATIRHIPYDPAATNYARFKITKVTTNDASTVLDVLKISYIPSN